MPQDSINALIAARELPGALYEEITFRGLRAGGVALLVEPSTDNHNRT